MIDKQIRNLEIDMKQQNSPTLPSQILTMPQASSFSIQNTEGEEGEDPKFK